MKLFLVAILVLALIMTGVVSCADPSSSGAPSDQIQWDQVKIHKVTEGENMDHRGNYTPVYRIEYSYPPFGVDWFYRTIQIDKDEYSPEVVREKIGQAIIEKLTEITEEQRLKMEVEEAINR